MPGLPQTAEYARALISAWQPADGRGAVEQQVSVRLERQHLVARDDPPLMWMIIGEAVLRTPVGGPAVLRDQLTRLLDLEAQHPKLIVRVVPLSAGAHPGTAGSLLLVARRDEPPGASRDMIANCAKEIGP